MTYEKNRILNEFAINLKLGRQLQFSAFPFFILSAFLKLKKIQKRTH
ncbi:hypothetical protein D840_01031 [Enterococcus faecalis 20.SD.W.06]|nr:hypothetical protein D840_01031 [Enterococcus faecalis 20.SD.W.06]